MAQRKRPLIWQKKTASGTWLVSDKKFKLPITIDTHKRSLRIFLWLVLLFCLAVLTKLIVFKWPLGYLKDHFLHHYNWRLIKANFSHVNLSPFATIKLYLNSHLRSEYAISNLLGNIAGFIPLGILLPLLFRKLRTAFRTVALIFLISLAFETAQLILILGVFDVDDLLLNTLGGAIGYLLFVLLRKTIQLV